MPHHPFDKLARFFDNWFPRFADQRTSPKLPVVKLHKTLALSGKARVKAIAAPVPWDAKASTGVMSLHFTSCLSAVGGNVPCRPLMATRRSSRKSVENGSIFSDGTVWVISAPP